MTENQVFIPGSGWDTESVVSGFIKVADGELAMNAIAKFPFDDVYPFTNIYWRSMAQYGPAVIGFAGSYKQIEEDWNEWLWKFSQLLSTLDGVEAGVSLSCILGEFSWILAPESRKKERSYDNRLPWHECTMHQAWGIVKAPPHDFCLRPEWLDHCQTDWNKFVPRWTNH